MRTAILTAATGSFAYALPDSIRSVRQAMCGRGDCKYILATDSEKIAASAKELWGGDFHHILISVRDDTEKYKEASQFVIAKLQGSLFDHARDDGFDLAWSVESDVIVHPYSFDGLKWVLESPMPRYDVAVATYWNGQFLCGRGTPEMPIMEDFEIGERKVPDNEIKKYNNMKKAVDSISRPQNEKEAEAARKISEEFGELRKKLMAYPPKENVFALNSKKWRRRGWLDHAYPGAAVKGAVLPTDWCGLGCTLLSKKALLTSDFIDYDGRGTQDLYLCYHRWLPAGIRIGLNVSVPATHVKQKDGKNIHYVPQFVSSGEFEGHLRLRTFENDPLGISQKPQSRESIPS